MCATNTNNNTSILHSNLQNGKTEMSDYHISATSNKKKKVDSRASDINLFYRWFFCVRTFKGWSLSFSICFIESFCFSLSFSYWFSFFVVICFNREKRCDGFPKWTVEVDPNFRSNHCNSKDLISPFVIVVYLFFVDVLYSASIVISFL